MKLSKDNPIIRRTHWAISQKNLMKFIPSMIHYGGWLLLAIYQLFGIKVLLLTTTGRKTGKARTNPVLYIKQGQEYIISAHQGGTDRHPYWYLNLKANPRVTVELYWRQRAYQAVEVTDEEQKKALLAQFPLGFVEALQEYTPRSFPVVRLQPVSV